MAKKKKDKLKDAREELESGDILEPMDISKLGTMVIHVLVSIMIFQPRNARCAGIPNYVVSSSQI